VKYSRPGRLIEQVRLIELKEYVVLNLCNFSDMFMREFSNDETLSH
jgi:hypothetical protein